MNLACTVIEAKQDSSGEPDKDQTVSLETSSCLIKNIDFDNPNHSELIAVGGGTPQA